MSLRYCLLALTFLSALVSSKSGASDPVATFEAFVKHSHEACAAATPTYLNRYKNQWAKRRFVLEGVKYDVKKTDSLVTPVVGIVQFRLRADQSALFQTRDEAERASEFPLKSDGFAAVTLRYAFKDDKWTFNEGEAESLTSGFRGPLTLETMRAEPNTVVSVAVLGYWLP